MPPLHLDDPYRGIFGVTVTPFTADGAAIDEGALAGLVGRLLAGGVQRLVPNGNTGEYHTLTVAERRRALEVTTEAAAGRAKAIVAGIGGAVEDAAMAAEHAARHGATAVMVHHPSHPFVTSAGLVAYLGAIAARSPLPIIPYLKSVPDDDALRRMADMPSVVGVKWGVNDLPAFGRAVALSRGRSDVRWICGTAELWAPFFWAVGAVGFTSGLVNVTTSLSPGLLDALEAGDRTRTMELWTTIAPFERLRSRSSDGYNVAVVKAAMRLLGHPVGPVRPPSSDVDEADETAIAGLLATWDLTRPAVAAR